MVQPKIFVADLQATYDKKQATHRGVQHVQEEVPMIGIANAIIQPSYNENIHIKLKSDLIT